MDTHYGRLLYTEMSHFIMPIQITVLNLCTLVFFHINRFLKQHGNIAVYTNLSVLTHCIVSLPMPALCISIDVGPFAVSVCISDYSNLERSILGKSSLTK